MFWIFVSLAGFVACMVRYLHQRGDVRDAVLVIAERLVDDSPRQSLDDGYPPSAARNRDRYPFSEDVVDNVAILPAPFWPSPWIARLAGFELMSLRRPAITDRLVVAALTAVGGVAVCEFPGHGYPPSLREEGRSRTGTGGARSAVSSKVRLVSALMASFFVRRCQRRIARST